MREDARGKERERDHDHRNSESMKKSIYRMPVTLGVLRYPFFGWPSI
jgi:hypothetical protein